MPKYPSTSLVTLAEKLAKIDDVQVRKDIETEIRKADLDLLDKVNKLSQQIDSVKALIPVVPSIPTITTEVAYTPTFTGFGVCTAISFIWSRVGNHIRIIGRFTTGTPTAVLAQISLPGSLIGDSTLIVTGYVCGNFVPNQPSASAEYCLCFPSQNYVEIGVQAAGAGGFNAVNGNVAAGVNWTIGVQFDLPIDGWNV